MIADHNLAIAAAWINRAHNWRNRAGSASLCQRISDPGRGAVIADDRRVAVITDDWRVAMIADDWSAGHIRAAGAVRRVAMVSDDRRLAMVADNWWISVIADYDFAIAAARVDRTHDRWGLARPARFRQWIDDLVGCAMIADDRRVAVVSHDGRTTVISHDRRLSVVSDNWTSAMIANDRRVGDRYTALPA
jgi:hypothetical protein